MATDWAQQYRDHYQALVRYLYRRVWDADEAQDLAQEVFARALGQDLDNPKAWLFRVATNLATDEARTAIRRRRQLARLSGETAVRQSTASNPGNDYERKEAIESVKRALQQLGDRDRDVLLLWDAGMSYREIAEETGLAIGAIGTTLGRARRKLVEAHRELENRHAARG